MLLSTYFQSHQFRRFIPDWITTGLLLVFFFLVAERARPFNRQFKLNDPTIQHPFADTERVSGNMCLLLASCVPTTVMCLVTLYKYRKSKDQAWHIMQVSILGLALTISYTGVVTDILKCWVGRPRPDFLERCGALDGTITDEFVDIVVCTAPLGDDRLADGMKSTPSGHSSISFSAFLFLTLWLYGQLSLSRHTSCIHHQFFAVSPLLLASYVALSRVQDYRHHFVDIFSGGILGCVISGLVYHKYFPTISSEKSSEPLGGEDEPSLPL